MGERLELLSVEQMYRADKAAVEAGVPGVELMENAGRAVAEAVHENFPLGLVAVLCGPGNNGGDGFVAARHLRQKGWQVRLALLGARESLKGDAAYHAGLWNGAVEALSPEVLEDVGVAVDALFGAGLTRPLEGAPAGVVEALDAARIPAVAVDVPSGVQGDNGAVLGTLAVRAALTVTFFRKKPGHLLMPGRSHCGRTILAQIGIPDAVLSTLSPNFWENAPALWRAQWPWRQPDSHKFRHGHAVVFGGETTTGAGRLAARAALRSGAGLVSVAAPRAALPIYAADTPSLIMRAVDGEGDVEAILDDPRCNAFLLGPGHGVTRETRALADRLLASGRAVLLDADALSVFAKDLDALAAQRRGPLVLTPHEGEFSRLFPDIAGDKLARARQAAGVSGAVVLLKGHDTVIAAPDGRAAINANAPAELATAGAGDVLAGIVAGALAQGLEAFDAACAAVWLHGAAAEDFGPGLIAGDLPDRLPKALGKLRDSGGF